MAYTYLRKDSPWVWICFLDTAGKRQRKPSDIRKNTPDANRRSRKLAAEYTTTELELPRVRRDADRWENWVPGYLERRYKDNEKSRVRMQGSWVPLAAYLEHAGVKTARGLTYAIAAAYIDWRRSSVTGLRCVGHNTAVMEMRLLSVLMGEAVRRGLAPVNPCREIELHKAPAKVKREFTLEDEEKIELGLAKEKPWMREAWLVYMRQGCRMSEVEVPLERIDTAAMNITFKIKGRGVRLHTAPLHPDMLPLIELARAEGRGVLITLPVSPAKKWHDFFKRCGVVGVSVHCTRVTVITRLIRAGADPVFVRQYIGHSSDEIQSIYRRLKPADAAGLTKFLGSPRPPSGA